VAGVLAVICNRLRLPSIAAFILAGMLIGPSGIALVENQSDVETIAKLGLVFLLFLVGLEINLRQLMTRGKTVIISGLLQMPLCVGLGYLAFLGARGVGILPDGFGARELIYLALACGFSSTLLVVKVLQERAQLDTVDGRVAIALLVFQDLWAIVVLSLQPSLLGDGDGGPMLDPLINTFAGVGVLLVVAVGVSRYILPMFFEHVARQTELIILFALAWCFGMGLLGAETGHVAHLFGIDRDISTSMEMGAMIAGASIATFPYAHEVVSKVGNLRDFFVTLFFIALGMTVSMPRDPMLVVAALVLMTVAFVLRGVVFFPLFYFTGLDRQNAVTTSTKLAQISEFALVIAFLGLGLKHVSDQVVTVVIFAFILTSILTPGLFSVSDRLAKTMAPLLSAIGIKPPPETEDDESGHGKMRIVLLGFHRLASSLVVELERLNPSLLEETMVVDTNAAIHGKLRKKGIHVHYGDIGNSDTVAHAVEGADVVVCTIPDDLLRGTSNVEVVKRVKAANPDAKLVVQALKPSDAKKLRQAGADHVFAWQVETAVGLYPAVQAALNGTIEDFGASRKVEGTDFEFRDELL
jgi:Kef-type K+ transport system membrane component KefB